VGAAINALAPLDKRPRGIRARAVALSEGFQGRAEQSGFPGIATRMCAVRCDLPRARSSPTVSALVWMLEQAKRTACHAGRCRRYQLKALAPSMGEISCVGGCLRNRRQDALFRHDPSMSVHAQAFASRAAQTPASV